MKKILPLITPALLGTAFAAQQSILPADLPATNTSQTYTTADSLVTLRAWADAAKTVSANIGWNGNFFGIHGGVNNNAIDSNATGGVAEQLEIALAAGAGLSELQFSFVSTQGLTRISGFTQNPGAIFNPGGNTAETGFPIYDSATGTVTLDFNSYSGTAVVVRFLNPAASAGQTLTINRIGTTPDTAARQTPLMRISYEDAVDSTRKAFGSEVVLPTNTVNSHTTGDGALTLSGWSDATQTSSATFGVQNRFFGVTGGGNDNAVNGAESATIVMAANAALKDVYFMWPSATGSVAISGFAGNPGATFNANGTPSETGTVSYSSGTLTVSFTSFTAYQRGISLANNYASAGRTLVFTRTGGTGQFSFNTISYINALPPVAPTITGPLPGSTPAIADVLTNLSVNLDPSTSPAPTYLWEFNSGSGFVTVGTNPIHAFTAGPATDGTYRVTVTNTSGSDTSSTVVTSSDDGDGINNQWEINFFGNHLLWGAGDDVDTGGPDGLTNAQEFAAGTNPTARDTDGDGLLDGQEGASGANPTLADTDSDGFQDGYEVNIAGTAPNDPNSSPLASSGRNSIGITFAATTGTGANVNLGPLALAGAPGLVQKNWNASAALANTSLTATEANIATPSAGVLVNSNGNPTGATFTIQAAGAFSMLNNPQQSISGLYSGYLFATAAAPTAFIDLDNIPYSRYDVVFYVMGFNQNVSGRIKPAGGTPEYGFRSPAILPAGTSPSWFRCADQTTASNGSSENFPIATHVIFRGLTGSLQSFDLNRVLDNAGIAAIQIVEDLDTDGDGMGDNFELSVGLNPNDNGTTNPLQAPGADLDGDTLSNIFEHDNGTNPNNPDSDADGIRDDRETDTGTYVSSSNSGTDPRIADMDGDGLLDGVETNSGSFTAGTDAGTDPFVASTGDTDLDGWADNYEFLNGPTNLYDANSPGAPGTVPNGFAIAFNAAAGTGTPAITAAFGPAVFAGAPGFEQKNWNRTIDLANNPTDATGTIAKIATPTAGNIVDSAGNVIGNGSTGVGLSFTAGRGAYSGLPDAATPYGRLFNSFIYGTTQTTDPSWNPNANVTLTGIPYSSYDVYVYFGSETNGRTGTISSSAASTTYSFTTQVNSGTPGAYTRTTDTGSGFPVANYAVFSGQTGGTFDVTLTVGANQNSMGIYGIQVVDTSSGSGPFESWAAANISDPAKRLPGDDADADGVENLAEFAFFTDPDAGGSVPQFTTAISGGDLTATYDRAIAATDVTYIAEWSSNLSDWFTSGITDQPTGNSDANTTEYRASISKGAGPAKFLRIRVVKP